MCLWVYCGGKRWYFCFPLYPYPLLSFLPFPSPSNPKSVILPCVSVGPTLSERHRPTWMHPDESRPLHHIIGNYKSMAPHSVSKSLKKCNLPPLQERRRHLRLTLYYRIVEGLIPALPPEKFQQQQKSGWEICTQQLNGKSCNPVNNYARHNGRPYTTWHTVPLCHVV